jgi:hypothetical protein
MAGGNKSVRFSERQVRVMATYLAQLEAEGVTYKTDDMIDGWIVTITGY